MQQLAWMIGRWEGTAWAESASTGRREFTYSVTVRPELDGLLLVVDMVGYTAPDRPIAYAKQVLVSGPPPAVLPGPPGTYSWQEPGSLGAHLMGNEAQGTNRSLEVGLPLLGADCDWIVDEAHRDTCRNGGGGAWSRTTISLNEQGEWIESRRWQSIEASDGSGGTYFSAVLRRVGQGARQSVSLGTGVTLQLQVITANRGTPHVYVDQGLETIAALRRQQVLMSRRYGTLGSARENWQESVAAVIEALSRLPD